MHCLRRATSRLSCSTIAYTPAAVSRSRATVCSSSVTSLRLPSHSAYRSALQARYYSELSNDGATVTLHRDDGEYISSAEDDQLETPSAFNKAPGKRALRHARLDAFDAPRAPSDTVYMGNLFYDITAEDLRKHMEQYGTVLKTVIVHDNRGLSKGFGYVQFNSIEEAQKAIEKQHMQVIAGRQVVVQYARSHIEETRRSDNPPSNTLFIGGIPFELTDRDIQNLFADVKNVIDIRVPVDRRSGMPRGFAHAEFLNVEYARRGMEVLMRKEPYGRKLRVHFAERKRIGLLKDDNEIRRAKFEQRVEEREARQAEEERMREAEAEAREWEDDSLPEEYQEYRLDERRV